MDRRLRRAPRQAIGRRRVETILEDVEIEGAQFLGGVVLQRLHHLVEFETLVVGADLRLQARQAQQGVAVELHHVFHRHRIARVLEVGHVGEHEAQGVAQPPVDLDDAIEDFLGDGELAGIVGGGHPQAQDFGAERVGDLLRRDDVAARLRHLQPLAVDHEAVREQPPVGRMPVDGAAGEQRRVEPATVLVGTL